MPNSLSPRRRNLVLSHASAGVLESLETRTLLSVSLNSAGWTVVTPPAGAKVIYCSSSSGNDANTGLSPSSPVQTIGRAESLVDDHSGDQLLFKAGDVFYGNMIFWSKSGLDAQDPIVIGSYGTGARPEIMTGIVSGFTTGKNSTPVDNVDVIGLHFVANGRDPNLTSTPNDSTGPVGINILSASTNILVEDCEVEDYVVDMNFQNYQGPIQNVTVRRNVIIDAFATAGHAEGLYATGVDNLTIYGNVFDHDGYNDQVPGAGPTFYNHDCYLSGENSNCVVEDNIFSRASGFGLQARSGGIVKDNIFIDDPVGLSFGLVNGATTTAGGVTGQVTDNVFIGGANIGTLPEGQAMTVGNINPAGVVISGNIITQGIPTAAPAISLSYGQSEPNPQDSVGINNLTLKGNIIYDWVKGIDVESGLSPGGSGITALNHLVFLNNQFENVTTTLAENKGNYESQETWSGNSYYNAGTWLENGVGVTPLATALSSPMPFSDPNRSVASYDSAIGGSGSVADFINAARNQSRQNWNMKYDASSAVSYIGQGFGLTMTPVLPGSSTGGGVSSGSTSTGSTSTGSTSTGSTSTSSGSTSTGSTSTGSGSTSTSGSGSSISGSTSSTTPRSATSTFSALKWDSDSGVAFDNFTGLGYADGGDWAAYKKIDFGSGVNTFTATVAAMAGQNGSVQIHLDSPTGTLIGTLNASPTGAWGNYTTQTTSVSGATGVHDVYLVFVGGTGVMNINTFSFTNAATSTFQALNYSSESGVAFDNFKGVGYADGGDWVEYNQVNFGAGVNTFTGNIAALAASAGSIQLRLDSPTGTLIGTLKVTPTGAWDNYTAQSTSISGATGVHKLYLVFVGGTGVANISSFSFTNAATSTFQALNYSTESGVAFDNFKGVGYADGGDWVEYDQVNFGNGVKTFTGNIAALAASAGSIQLRLDSPTGTLVGTLKVTPTGAWNNYTTQTTSVSGATGVHKLYLVFVGGIGVANVDTFSFS